MKAKKVKAKAIAKKAKANKKPAKGMIFGKMKVQK